MGIVDFYTKLSDILGRYRVSNKVDASQEIDALLVEAKIAGLSINIDKENLIKITRDGNFDEEMSYDGELEDEQEYEDETSYSYDEDDDNN